LHDRKAWSSLLVEWHIGLFVKQGSECAVDVTAAFLKHVYDRLAVIAATKALLDGVDIPGGIKVNGQVGVSGISATRSIFCDEGYVFAVFCQFAVYVGLDVFAELWDDIHASEKPLMLAIDTSHGGVMFKVLWLLAYSPKASREKQDTYVVGDVKYISGLMGKRIDISKHLDSVHGANIQIHLEDLAECLEMLRASPFAISASRRDHVLEPTLLVLKRRG
jgi:hypothetical protein